MSQAVPGTVRGFVTNAGQVCSAGTRVCLVEKSVHDDFVAGRSPRPWRASSRAS